MNYQFKEEPIMAEWFDAVKNNDDKTSYSIAVESGNKEILDLLKRYER